MCNNAELGKTTDDVDSTCIICENKFTCHLGVPQQAEETDGLYLCDLACLICGEPLDQSAYFEHPGVGGERSLLLRHLKFAVPLTDETFKFSA